SHITSGETNKLWDHRELIQTILCELPHLFKTTTHTQTHRHTHTHITYHVHCAFLEPKQASVQSLSFVLLSLFLWIRVSVFLISSRPLSIQKATCQKLGL